ncbi:hypothetical protein BASA50_005484 [Batrachochytrium salamandrivorans]|uniref:NTF2 domain-containing protein n=1 Tax=Batrachochytrium salamandrivorans TaxID=1357716 RepID=A0ABQ8FD04_9FUNG|nr:hypothetical protein BASA50_005484 [Batrachochytrium salamandrivorans]
MTAAVHTTPAAMTENKVDSFEVGWLFVQEYYTFLNKDPERLHCFYNKRSVFLHGTEGENIETSHGQSEIHKRIMDLDFESCKVLVSNVDSQASHDGGILVQVLGEMSNNGGASHKFAQTFFLAVQPNGYFVLNDIFRFLKEDIDNVYEESEDPVGESAYYMEPTASVQQRSPSPTHAPTSVASTNAAAANAAAVAQHPAPSKATHHQTQGSVPPAYTDVAEAPAVVASTVPTTNGRSSSPVRSKPAFTETKSAPTTADKPKEAHKPSKTTERTTPASAPLSASTPAVVAPTQTPASTPAPVPTPTSAPAPAPAPTQAAAAAAAPRSASPKRQSSQAPPTAASTPAPAAAPAPPASWARLVSMKDTTAKPSSATLSPQKQPHGSTPATAPTAPAASLVSHAKKTEMQPTHQASAPVDGHSDEGFHQVQHNYRQNRARNNNPGNAGSHNNSEERDKNSIYLRNISSNVDSAMLMTVFSAVGPIRNIEIPQGKHSAFVEFTNSEAALKAIGTPFMVGGVQLIPEERRKPGPGMNRSGSSRGGANTGGFQRNNNNNSNNGNLNAGRGRGGYQGNRYRGNSSNNDKMTTGGQGTSGSSEFSSSPAVPQLLSTSIAHLVVECEQVAGHRIQSGLVPAIQKSRLRLLGRALDPGVENVYTWLRGGVLNGEADLDQRWLDGTVEHESMGTRHDNQVAGSTVS